MNKKLLLLALLPVLSLTACSTQGQVQHPWYGGNVTTTTMPYDPADITTTTTTPTPDLNGQYCWTETNPQSPDGVEGLCYTDMSKVNHEYFLHWGMPNVADSARCWTAGQGLCNIRNATDDVQTLDGNWVPRSFFDEQMKSSNYPNIAATMYLPNQVITEDSKWWRCSIDGNKVCGNDDDMITPVKDDCPQGAGDIVQVKASGKAWMIIDNTTGDTLDTYPTEEKAYNEVMTMTCHS